jgi:hypothetical protein
MLTHNKFYVPILSESNINKLVTWTRCWKIFSTARCVSCALALTCECFHRELYLTAYINIHVHLRILAQNLVKHRVTLHVLLHGDIEEPTVPHEEQIRSYTLASQKGKTNLYLSIYLYIILA